MNNLERKLIELTFPTVNVDALMEVIVATPNSRVATEILCGIYTEPEVPSQKMKNGLLCTFISYDKWEDQVRYKYSVKQKIGAYFPNTVAKEDITIENMDSLKVSGNSHEVYYHNVETNTMVNKESACSLENWERSEDVVNEYALAE